MYGKGVTRVSAAVARLHREAGEPEKARELEKDALAYYPVSALMAAARAIDGGNSAHWDEAAVARSAAIVLDIYNALPSEYKAEEEEAQRILLRLAEEGRMTVYVAHACASLAELLTERDPEECLRLADRAEVSMRGTSSRGPVAVLARLVRVYTSLGSPEDERRLLWQLVAAADACADHSRLRGAVLRLSRIERDDPAALARLEAYAPKLTISSTGLALPVWRAIIAGDLDGALDAVDGVIEVARRAHNRALLAEAHNLRLAAAMLGGRTDLLLGVSSLLDEVGAGPQGQASFRAFSGGMDIMAFLVREVLADLRASVKHVEPPDAPAGQA